MEHEAIPDARVTSERAMADAVRHEKPTAEDAVAEDATDNQAVEAATETETDEVANDAIDDPDDESRRTLRIAFVGNVDSGKSSLIGAFICVRALYVWA